MTRNQKKPPTRYLLVMLLVAIASGFSLGVALRVTSLELLFPALMIAVAVVGIGGIVFLKNLFGPKEASSPTDCVCA